MGSLVELKDPSKQVHLLLASSNLAEIYVYDTLKSRCNATLESIMDVNSTSSFKAMLELVNIQPNLADKWLFVIDYKKVRSLIKKTMGIFQSDTSVFLLKVNTYKDFKEVKELDIDLNDLYLETIRKQEVQNLLRGYKISPKVVDFVASSYYRDPEKVFALRKELDNGADVNSPKDVTALCGESLGSVQKFAMQLLTDKPKTEMFLKRSYKKRVNVLCDLCDTFGSSTAYNYIKAAVKDILYIKMLYMEGTIYNRIRELPDCFDEKKLSKYNHSLRDIEFELQYVKILHLYNLMSSTGRWRNSQDGVLFLYQYYLELIHVWND